MTPSHPQPSTQEASAWAEALIQSRRTTLPKRLVGPGPDPEQRQKILYAAAAAPDHDQLVPWRFIEVATSQRDRLGHAFVQALLHRDPAADEQAQAMAREKAQRAPWLLLAVVCKGKAGDDVPDSERLLSLGAAVQNMLLQATATGLGSSLTSGQAMSSTALRQLFRLAPQEDAVCFINIGHVSEWKRPKARPAVERYFSRL
jgi:nitroreductase